MRTMQTPKFTRDHLKEKNALMRTPASFAPSGAWGHDNEPSNLLEIVEEERMAGVKVCQSYILTNFNLPEHRTENELCLTKPLDEMIPTGANHSSGADHSQSSLAYRNSSCRSCDA